MIWTTIGYLLLGIMTGGIGSYVYHLRREVKALREECSRLSLLVHLHNGEFKMMSGE